APVNNSFLQLSKGTTMHESVLSPVRAAAGNNRRRGRRRAHTLSSLFEAIVSDAHGNRVEGAASRQGVKLNGAAQCYQFRNGDEDLAWRALQEPAICTLRRRRLRALLSPTDLDLLHLRFAAGWSQAAVAEEWGCNRSTIKRREERIRRKLLTDPALQQAA